MLSWDRTKINRVTLEKLNILSHKNQKNIMFIELFRQFNSVMLWRHRKWDFSCDDSFIINRFWNRSVSYLVDVLEYLIRSGSNGQIAYFINYVCWTSNVWQCELSSKRQRNVILTKTPAHTDKNLIKYGIGLLKSVWQQINSYMSHLRKCLLLCRLYTVTKSFNKSKC